MARAEEPPSRTRHLISNCQVSETEVPDVFAVRLNYLLYRAQKSAMKPLRRHAHGQSAPFTGR